MGIKLLEDINKFSKNHSEMRDYVAEIHGTYKTCQVEKLLGNDEPDISLEEMYRHIYEENGGCDFCKDRMNSMIVLRKNILKKAKKITEHRDMVVRTLFEYSNR